MNEVTQLRCKTSLEQGDFDFSFWGFPCSLPGTLTVGVPPWVGLAGFLEQTPPFLLHLANRVVYENAFWLCAKINSACSLLGKEGVCVGRGVLGEKWAGHLVSQEDQGREDLQKRRGHCAQQQDSGHIPIRTLPSLCPLLWNQAILGLNSSTCPLSLEPLLCPQQDSELYAVSNPTTVCLLRLFSTILSRQKQIRRKTV